MTPLLAQHLRADRPFERMYRRHVADVYHYALAICCNETDAEDVTQTTFMNAYRAVQAGHQPRAPKNWLIAIAHNVCRQRFRQAARRPDEVELDDGVGAFVPEEQGPSAADIRRALGELAFNQRAALVMRELEGRSYAEIAEIIGVSVSAVETLIFRARRALREQLDGSLTCHEAELALSKQLDGRLPRSEKSALRAHIRACKECATFARSQRAQRSVLKGLAAVPLPSALSSFFGGGGAAVGTALATKAAAVTAVGLLITGAGVETARRHPWRQHHVTHARLATPTPTAHATPMRVATRQQAQLRRTEVVQHSVGRTASPAPAKHAAVSPGVGPAAPVVDTHAQTTPPTHPVHAAKAHKPKTQGHGRGTPRTAVLGKPALTPRRASGTPNGNGHGKGGAQAERSNRTH